jgi:triacylglycerol esterase/lipase EstA (alpha/beta hydrolase family)
VLARLQQALSVALAALALGWAVRAGSPGHALMGLALAALAYAGVLGLEFWLMHRVNRGDAAPRATTAQVLRAWWGEVLSGPRVFGWRQPWRSRRWPDQPAGAGRRGVLLVHGFVCNRGLWNPWCERLQSLGIPWVAVNLEPVFGAIDDYVPAIERAVQRLEQGTGLAPVVVAHSMGGLALRRWWAEPGNEARVHHAITIGTPHHGTWLARWAASPNGRQMQLHGPWLRDLAAREPATRAARTTCFYGHCDNIVFPASCATLAGADNRHLPGVAHVHMADHPAPYAELRRWL